MSDLVEDTKALLLDVAQKKLDLSVAVYEGAVTWEQAQPIDEMLDAAIEHGERVLRDLGIT